MANSVFRFIPDQLCQRHDFLAARYQFIEKELEDFVAYVPLENRWKVFSPKLDSLLYHLCSYIEDGLKIISFSPDVKEEELKSFEQEINLHRKIKINFENEKSVKKIGFYELLCFNNKISGNKLSGGRFMIQRWYGIDFIEPFPLLSEDQRPKWFSDYGKVKHNKFDSMKKANISNTLNALAAFYLLCKILNYKVRQAYGKFEIPWYEAEKKGYEFSIGGDSIVSKFFQNFDYESPAK